MQHILNLHACLNVNPVCIYILKTDFDVDCVVTLRYSVFASQ